MNKISFFITILSLFGTALGLSQCDTCKFVMSVSNELIQQNYTYLQIETLIDDVCIEFECHQIVSNHLLDSYHMLLSNHTVDTICQDINYCTYYNKCTICESFIGFLDNVIKDSNFDLQSEFDKFCSLMPKKYNSICLHIDAYFDYVIDSIFAKEMPLNICQNINICAI